MDAIADICGACLALELLDVDRVVSAPPALGSGTVTCAHGTLPVPVPAVAALLEGVPVQTGPVACELTTPTGAVLLRVLADEFSGTVPGRVCATGYGAGTRELEDRPNVLQAVLLESDTADQTDTVVELSCNLDDMPGQRMTHLFPQLLEGGALDVTATPCTMKKGRPGLQLQLICPPSRRQDLARLVLRHSTSFGVRWHECRRCKLRREFIEVPTTAGDVRVKLGYLADETTPCQVAPEYESCAAAARDAGAAYADVHAQAVAAAREQVL